MSADPLVISSFNSTVQRHRVTAIDGARHVAEIATRLADELENSTGANASDANRIETMACELARHVAAINALHEVGPLVTNQYAEKF